MKKIISIMLCFSLLASNVQIVNAEETGQTDQYHIYPIVRDISYDETEFVMDDQVNVVYETGIDDATKSYLEEVLEENGITPNTEEEAVDGECNILLGIDGSKEAADIYEDSVALRTTDLYDRYDGYLLEAKEKNITIVGKDSDAVFRGVSTLKMMFSSSRGNRLLGAHIEDYSEIEYRGFIEGFYGGWDYETRESLMKFARDVKMNLYVYASKTDAYHTSKWNELYPDEEIGKIADLVKVGEDTKCYYTWSVHLSGFFNGLDVTDTQAYESRYEQLIAKFTQLYDAGVRKFDILNDDFGSGSHEDVVTLLNRLNEEFIEARDCKPMTYCPQGYNKSWSGDGSELDVLAGLDDSIILYWTGDDVNSPITQSTVDYVKEKTGQDVSFWLNYPVNEHAASGIFLGDITYYTRDGVTGLRAAVSNPSRFGQSNKAALFQLASFFWNNENYSAYADEIWTNAFDYLEPEAANAYLTIARNTSNCPNSSRITTGFPESEYLKDHLEAVISKVNTGQPIKGTEDIAVLQTEFTNILNALEEFKRECSNTALIEELTPWLNSLTDVTTACDKILRSLIALEDENISEAWSEFAAASQALQSWNTYPTYEGSNQKALAGSKRLQPFAVKMINYVQGALAPLLDSNYTDFTPTLYARLGGAEQNQDANGEKIFDGDTSTYAQWSVNQRQDDYFGVDLGRVMKVTDISILQASSDTHHDYFHKAVLEYSEDGITFTSIGEQYNDTVSIEVDDLDIQARYVRLRLVETGTESKADYWTNVREFTVNKEKPDGNRIYTNVEEYRRQPLTITGKEYSIENLSDVTLESGEYIGMKFVNLSGILGFVKKGTGLDDLTLEMSDNGVLWQEITDLTQPQVLKYVRLINQTDRSVSFELEKMGVSVENVKADPAFLETNLTNGLQQGSWENLFDGELSTYVWTNEAQTAGDYIVFDLGSVVSLYDMSIVTADGNPRFYDAEIQISADQSQWETIATVQNDNSVFEVPYRYVNADDLGGRDARYLRIYITGNTGWYLKIHEIIINASVDSDAETEEITATFGSDAKKAIDGNLSTLFSGTASADDYIEYKFTETTRYQAVSILQDPNNLSNAIVKILTDNGYEEIASLDESAKKIVLDSEKDIYALRIEFSEETDISIYEIYPDAANAAADDIGEYVEPVIGEPDSAPIPSNIAFGKDVTVSGTSDGDKNNVNDKDTSTKWDSNFIKGNNASDNSWIVIDLGNEQTSIFNSTKISYYNKIYPTDMEVQISNDGENWITVSELTREHNGPTYPVVTDTYEPALSARYVRLFFKELNSAAAGNGVGITEWEITGVSLSDVSVKEVQSFEDAKVELNTPVSDLGLADFVTVTLTHEAAGDYEVKIPVTWNTDAYDPAADGVYKIEGVLNLPESVKNADEMKAVLNITVGAGEVDEPSATPVTDIFTDVTKGSWYEEAVQYVYDKGLMEGNGDKFTPNGRMTRGMFVTTLYRLAGEPEVTDRLACTELHDVGENAWYTDAVCWAYANRITTGYENDMTFRTNVALTREQLATFLHRYAQYQGMDVSDFNDLTGLLNADKVKDYAIEGVKWAVGAGIINGMEITDEAGETVYDLAPQKTATRVQMAKILMNFCEAY